MTFSHQIPIKESVYFLRKTSEIVHSPLYELNICGGITSCMLSEYAYDAQRPCSMYYAYSTI